LVAEILNDANLARQIEGFTLMPSDGGRFEFTVNGDLIFSKKKLGRHAEPGEMTQIFKKYIEEHA